jgi:tetratricopeptide (TPR) repeat protein
MPKPPDTTAHLALEGADARHFCAAQGWLELGSHIEANAELEKITPANRTRVNVLHLRWHIYAKAGQWDACLDLGEALVKLAPSAPQGWINRSVALHVLNRTQDAFDLLEPAAELFSGEWLVRYNLAAFACNLGRQEEMLVWLGKAFKVGNARAMKLMALDDPDIEPFWAEIGEI